MKNPLDRFSLVMIFLFESETLVIYTVYNIRYMIYQGIIYRIVIQYLIIYAINNLIYAVLKAV